MITYSFVSFSNHFGINPLMPGGNKKVTRTQTNLQLNAFGESEKNVIDKLNRITSM